ncbi:DUF6115 domain-containing protein [Anoxybacteroides amylolyticum]|uniref:Putative swrB n=1 Tax=Anoxybacteroides amylolyticum TaxID=294699 RepID=A0A160F362_9BACL|nr:hypothetical protein [Anoxybacillus amylolyticus]ANB60003.1 putative swrB [Anoxybacillus amylolyticus]
MIALLLTISFVLHALSLFIIILLYLQLTKIKEVEKRQSQIIEEMEQTVSAYFIEWKEENERFLQALSKTLHHRSSAKNETKAEKSEAAPSTALFERKESEWSPLAHVDQMKDTVEIRTIRPKPAPLSLAEQVVQLYKEGKTIEEIAKMLKKGKTEIELLLKFRQM